MGWKGEGGVVFQAESSLQEERLSDWRHAKSLLEEEEEQKAP